MQIQDVAPEAGAIALRTLPGATGTAGLAMSGEQMLSLGVGVLTAIFLLIQIAYAVWKWVRNSKLEGTIP